MDKKEIGFTPTNTEILEKAIISLEEQDIKLTESEKNKIYGTKTLYELGEMMQDIWMVKKMSEELAKISYFKG